MLAWARTHAFPLSLSLPTPIIKLTWHDCTLSSYVTLSHFHQLFCIPESWKCLHTSVTLALRGEPRLGYTDPAALPYPCKRETEIETERQLHIYTRKRKDRGTDTHRELKRDRDTEIETEKWTHKHREGEKKMERVRKTEREKGGERERDWQTEHYLLNFLNCTILTDLTTSALQGIFAQLGECHSYLGSQPVVFAGIPWSSSS